MKFSEILFIVMILLVSLSALASLEIIPIPGKINESLREDVNWKGNKQFEIDPVDRTIKCDTDNINTQNPDTYCKIMYLKDIKYGSGSLIDSNIFGFSDIIKAVQLFGDIFFTAIFRVDILFDNFVSPTNPVYNLKYLFLLPIYILYAFAFIEIISGRQIMGTQ
jgi:hypothetical protein